MSYKRADGIIPIHLEGFGTIEEKQEINAYYGNHPLKKGYDFIKIILAELRRRTADEKNSQSGTKDSQGIAQ